MCVVGGTVFLLREWDERQWSLLGNVLNCTFLLMNNDNNNKVLLERRPREL